MQTHSLAKDLGTLAVMGVITFSISSSIYTNVEQRAQLNTLALLAQVQESNVVCGNGILDRGEECDDGNVNGNDSCDTSCRFSTCGNGVCEQGEDRVVMCPSCTPDTPPEKCRCVMACEQDCRKDDPPPPPPPPAPVCGNGVCELGESRFSVCPMCVAGTPPEQCRCTVACEADCDSDQPPPPDRCEPIVCRDGSRHDTCTADGHPINYFAFPCRDDGDIGGIHESPPLQPYCKDSDGGMAIYQAGRTEEDGKIKHDYCEGPKHVFEYFCRPGLKGERVECPYGCEDGACIEGGRNDECAVMFCPNDCSNGRCEDGPIGRPVEMKCEDSDGGKFAGERGEVWFMSSTDEANKEDRCLSENLLMEYYCSEWGDIQSAQIKCERGCVRGRCIEDHNMCDRMRCQYGCENGRCLELRYDEYPMPPRRYDDPSYGGDYGYNPEHKPPYYYELDGDRTFGPGPDMMNMSKEEMLKKLEMTPDDQLPPGMTREDIKKKIEMMMQGGFPPFMDGPRGMPWGDGDDWGDDDWNDDWGDDNWDEGEWGDEDHDPWQDDGAPPAGYEDVIRVNEIGTPSRNWFSDTDVETNVGKAANILADRAIIGGYPDGTFKAGNPVNRAEAAKFLLTARYGQVPDMQSDGRFWDVRKGEWYVKYVMYAAKLGVIGGNPDGSFLPGNTVNTAEFLKMLSITFDLETGGSHNYDDIPEDAWFAEFASIAQKYGLFEGRTSSLEPQEALTRGEVAVAIAKILSQ